MEKQKSRPFEERLERLVYTDMHSLRNFHASSNIVRYAQDQNEAGHGYEEVDPDPVVEGLDEGPYVILLPIKGGDNGVGSRCYKRGKVNVLGLIPGPKERAWKITYTVETRCNCTAHRGDPMGFKMSMHLGYLVRFLGILTIFYLVASGVGFGQRKKRKPH